MPLKLLEEADLKDKVVLIRSDFNVPISNGVVTDNTRIIEAAEGYKYLIAHEVKKIIILTHLGRPNGMVVEELKVGPLVRELEGVLGEEIMYIDKSPRQITKDNINNVFEKIIFLENIRFDSGDEKNDPKLAERLAKLADLFVLDGFAVAHGEHASVTGITKFIPSYAGINLMHEKNKIDKFLGNISKPFWGFFGGIKLNDKIPVIKSLATKLNGVVFGSSIATAFLDKFGYGVGSSIVANNSREAVSDFLDFMKANDVKVIFPKDLIVGDVQNKVRKLVFEFDFEQIINDENRKLFDVCAEGEAISDIGDKSIEAFAEIINKSNTMFWNGPFGWVEESDFAVGSLKLADLLAKAKATTMVGGGDTVAFLNNNALMTSFEYVSTSGGAMMEYVANGDLPGLKALRN
ncbi:MAG TPA: phosphoglycerate kinase [bacterium]|nr:phosphoglycerate kinase [bacterium]